MSSWVLPALDWAVALSVGLIGAPLLGGIIAGLDRKVSARMQSRQGPPISQPFWDVLKLLGKEPTASSRAIVFSAWAYLMSAAASVVLLLLRGDLLVVFFVQAVGASFLVIGAMSVRSPFSQIGAQRELMQILAYEPLLLLVFVSIYMVTGSFRVADVLAHPQPLLLELPLMFVVLGYALTVKLRKSPFDISTSHHGHQEVVKGVLTEYSGPFLALTEIAHWYETVLILAIVALFWATAWWGALLLVLGSYFLELLVDNSTARLTWRWLLRYTWGFGLALSALNIGWVLYSR